MNIGRLSLVAGLACLAPLVLCADASSSDHFAYVGCGPYPGPHTAWRMGDGFRVDPAVGAATQFCKPGAKSVCRWIVYFSPFLSKCRAARLDSGWNWHSGFDVRDLAADNSRAAGGPVIKTTVIHVKDPASGKATHVRRSGPKLFSLTTS
jgi:hypothetical protein